MTRTNLDENSSPLFCLSLKKLSLVTVVLLLASMLFCFITSMIFNFELVNTTICQVFNFCPSVSAITGISPQRYVWRIGVALHSTPRLLLASVYYSHYVRKAKFVKDESKSLYQSLIKFNYWFHVTEIMALVGVTYISNKENYPVHEKIFITFMAASISYMLSTCILSHMNKSPEPTYLEKLSYRTKLFLCALIAFTSLGMMYFFYKHRVYCEELGYCVALSHHSNTPSYYLWNRFANAGFLFVHSAVQRHLPQGNRSAIYRPCHACQGTYGCNFKHVLY